MASLEEENKSKKSISLDLFNFEEYDKNEAKQEDNSANKIKERLDEIDINRVSPIEALNILYELKEMK